MKLRLCSVAGAYWRSSFILTHSWKEAMSNNGRSRQTARPHAPLTLCIQRIELLRLSDPAQSEAADRSEATAVLSDVGGDG